jgi:hypothetical protein
MTTVSEEIAKGMAGAEELTSEDRKTEMLEAIKTVAKEKLIFTADDVWERLGGVGDDERDNGSGLGPVMYRAKKKGIIAHTGTFRRSERPCTHGRPLPVWRPAGVC